MRENKIQADCLGWVKQTHPFILPINIHGGGWNNKGFPDLILVINGHFVAVELKSKDTGYQLQPDQKIWKKRIEKAGGDWRLIYSLDEFKDYINELVSIYTSRT